MPIRLLSVGFFSVLMLSACSFVPDAANPVEWGKTVADWASGDKTQEAAGKSEAPIPGEDQGFPALNQPLSRPEVANPQERRLVAQGLLADRDNAGHVDPVRRQNMGSADYRAPAVDVPSAPPERVQLVEGLTEGLTQGLKEGPNSSTQSSPASSQTARSSAPMPSQTVQPSAEPVVTPRPVDGGSVVIDEVQLATLGMESDTLSLGGVDTPVSAPARRAALEDRVALSAGVQPLSRYQPFGASQSHLAAQIQFADGSANLSAKDRAILNQVVSLVSEWGGRLRVIGHASRRTRNLDLPQHVGVNFKISEERAASVAAYLRKAGVPANVIFVGAVGAAEPRYYNGTPAGEAGNRRVEIFIDY